MRRRHAANMAADRAIEVEAEADGQEIADPCFVEVTRHLRMRHDPVERIADQCRAVDKGVEQRANAQAIARGQEAAPALVPQREAEIAGDRVDEPLTPLGIGVKTKREIGNIPVAHREPRPEIAARIEAHVADDPVRTERFDGPVGECRALRPVGCGKTDAEARHREPDFQAISGT